ncbi:putative TIM barrel metal-dependent hydrolase [Xylariaceae sp. FL0255]|nr:putative TIM barrel metal-dependent hydrolase [Xylariaceae sp. FL0255]
MLLARISRRAAFQRSLQSAPVCHQARNFNSSAISAENTSSTRMSSISKDATPLAIDPRLPQRSWDSHMHILEESYPLSSSAQYKPKHFHTLQDWEAFHPTVGIPNIVFVQPSIYGNDNDCLLDGLRALGPDRARGVVTFDPTDPRLKDQLPEWHALGVRGVRVNLKSVGRVMDQDELTQTLQAYADVIRPLGWVIQVYLPMVMVPLLEAVVPTLGGVRVIVDHMGHPPVKELQEYSATGNVASIPGLDALIRLLRAGSTYTKISGAYRMSGAADGFSDVLPLARELIRIAPDKVVFATDWPHTRFEGLDIRPWIGAVLDLCQGDEAEKLFRTNAEVLWGVRDE